MSTYNEDGKLPPPRKTLSELENSPINIPPLRETAANAENHRNLIKNRLGSMVIGIAICAGLMAVSFWWGHELGRKNVNIGPLPIVTAETSPVKIIPENREGLKVPFKEVVILGKEETDESLSQGKASLQDPPEKPIQIDEATSVKNVNTLNEKPASSTATSLEVKNNFDQNIDKNKKSTEISIENNNNKLANRNPATKGKLTAKSIAKSDQLVPKILKTDSDNNSSIVEDKLNNVDKNLKSKQHKNEKIKISNNTFNVQLASYRSKENANAGWNTISKKHKNLMNDLESKIIKADLVNKGVYYRLQAGPFRNKSEALTFCKKLKKFKQACFVVKN
tara:strand:- start:262 stop:1269 length:1008 start_codon:yes stop_codon:yes gene_type:complete